MTTHSPASPLDRLLRSKSLGVGLALVVTRAFYILAMIHILYCLAVGLVAWCFVGLVISTVLYFRLGFSKRRVNKNQGRVNKEEE
jgi:hypothetical protein